MPAHTENEVRIEAPLSLVWRVTNELERWPDLFSEYQSVEILERAGNTVRFRLTMRPDEHGRVWSWVSERTMDPATHTTRSHRIETGPFEYMRIQWLYQPVEGGTVMRWVQDFQMKPTAPVNDEQMAARINRNSPVQMGLIKAAIEAMAREGEE